MVQAETAGLENFKELLDEFRQLRGRVEQPRTLVESEATRLENFKELLDDFRTLPGRVERPRTFMEIAGYPHYENVCSNILKFFMDPEESHGLGTLVLDALASTAGIDVAEGSMSSNVSVDREISTDAGNRIDILITSDTHAILIENKIHAAANNPFNDYAAYLDRISDGRKSHKILLTLCPTDSGSEWDFANLTHEEFVGQVRSLLGYYVSNADARHLTMFLDFLNTLENLQRGSRMNQEFVKLLADRDDDIRSLFDGMKSFRADMRSKGEELNALINIKEYPNIEQLFWNNIVDMFDNLQYRINVAEDLLVGIDVNVNPSGWEIRIYPRDKGDPLKLRDILQSLEIEFEKREGWRRDMVYPAHFAYDENLEQISPILQEIIDKLATYQEE
jgi:hypothetical protein